MAISKAFIQKTLKNNMKKLNDAYIDCEYTSNISQIYDATDGSFEDSDTPDIFQCKALIASFSFTKNQSDFVSDDISSVQEKDKKAIVESRFFPDGFQPKKDDELYDKEELIKYVIVGKNIDPFKSIFILHLRPVEE